MNDKNQTDPTTTSPAESAGLETRFPELAEIQREVELRIRDNQRFLERFLDDDFVEEDLEPDEDSCTTEEL